MLELFITFFKVGIMTFGGGYAMLPILQREIVDNKGWATEEELLDYFAIGQCTPGVIAVNTSTFIGRKNGGIIGAIVATLGVVAPSIIIITIIAGLIQNFADLPVVKNAFSGIRACVCVLILNATVKLVKSAVVDGWTAAIFALTAVLSFAVDVSPIVFVMAALILGILIKTLESKRI
ncbi:MAG: chromate transporter [Eubacteriaceae bacterium]|nr:chromate transporter [Eubacteriaceae bacterium]